MVAPPTTRQGALVADVSPFDAFKDGIGQLGVWAGEAKETFELGKGILVSLGFDLPGMKEERAADGGWIINGIVYPGADSQWSALDGMPIKNADLPDWFPFGALVTQLRAWEDGRKLPTAPAGLEMIEPSKLAATLATWVQAGASPEEMLRLQTAEPTIGTSTSDPATMNGPQLRAYWTSTILVAAAHSMGDVATFYPFAEALTTFWRDDAAGRCNIVVLPPGYTSSTTDEQKRAAGICVGVELDAAGQSLADVDRFGRLASPAPGDYLARARAILRFLRTGEIMQEVIGSGSFAGFESCVRSGDEACLANYQPSSPDFWAALREPWRFGYKRDKKIQVVKNSLGTFLAWDFGKPRGITIGAAVAISLPAVIAIGTIAALTIYAKGKTGGR